MYWDVHPGEATVSDVRRLVKEVMEEMPRKLRVGVTIVERANVKGTAWATMSVAKREWRLDPNEYYGGRWISKTWRIRITRRCLFLPLKDLKETIMHEIVHGYGIRGHRKEMQQRLSLIHI